MDIKTTNTLEEMTKTDFEILAEQHLIAYSKLKSRIAQGEITLEEAESELENHDKLYDVYTALSKDNTFLRKMEYLF